jgi:lipopolysaccharide/colanic/teichoic acid biosynthesis glycosyltransferase
MESAATFYRMRGKRWLDVTAALCGLVVSAPLMALLALLVRLLLGGPVLFRQTRPGRGGRSFELLKFRTMTDQRDANGTLLPDSERLTPFGAFLRSTSLDELPELWNVLRGEMSLVGPRPLLMKYLDLYTPDQARRHEVLPGITGLAQVSGRNGLSWDNRFALDVRYVRTLSFKGDLLIVARTIGKVLSREGIIEEGAATMSEFRGSVPAAPGRQ